MYFCRFKKHNIMATITLEYDGRNKAINKLIDAILLLGAKEKKEKEITIELTENEEKEAFLYTSKIFASKAFAKHLDE